MGMGSTIVIFLTTFAITTVISTLLKAFIPLTLKIELSGMSLVFQTMEQTSGLAFGIGDIIFTLVTTVIFFVMSSWFMKHKINLR